jgi:hypothetical protein
MGMRVAALRGAHLVEEAVAHARAGQLRLLENLDDRVVLVQHQPQLPARAGAAARFAAQRLARAAHPWQHGLKGDGAVQHHSNARAHVGGALGRLDEARTARPAREPEQLRLQAHLRGVQLRRAPADAVQGEAGQLACELDQVVQFFGRHPSAIFQHARQLLAQRLRTGAVDVRHAARQHRRAGNCSNTSCGTSTPARLTCSHLFHVND